MIVAIASGKGGTGKTTVSAALASVWPRPVIAMDLDVEEPNLHLFLKPRIEAEEKAFIEVPEADESKCNYCRACADLCQFKAISVLGNVLMIFSEMCHGCGGCLAVCPENVLSPGRRELGEVVRGTFGDNDFLMGRSRVGEAMSPPLMRAAKQKLPDMLQARPADVIVDAPPGVSCPAVNAVMDADVIVLVTEPTPFGMYDLELAHEAFLPLGKPMGVVINRAGLGENKVYDFCRERNLPIWMEIPFDREIAAAYANGRVVAALSAGLQDQFAELAAKINKAGVRAEAVSHA
ncbi:MAG: ATP-binding protein [Desulfosarcinaceae bacterium]